MVQKAAKLHNTGAWAQAVRGTPAMGLSPTQTKEARKAAAKSTKVNVGGRYALALVLGQNKNLAVRGQISPSRNG